MTYDKQILQILTEVDEQGISVSSLTKHLYNENCTFFYQPDMQEIRQYVQQYLLKNSKSPQSLIESTGKRGYYRLNTQRSVDAHQLMLEFQQMKDQIRMSSEESDDEITPENSSQDFSLNLFEDF